MTFVKELERQGLSNYVQDIVRWGKNTVTLYTLQTKDKNVEVGRTKFGGYPDLPNDWRWPTCTVGNDQDGTPQESMHSDFANAQSDNEIKTRSRRQQFWKDMKEVLLSSSETRKSVPWLAFLAQIRLDDLKDLDIDGVLPKQGMLYFFYDYDSQPVGNTLDDQKRHKVLFYDDDMTKLVRTTPPPNTWVFRTHSIEFGHTMDYLGGIEELVPGMSDRELGVYYDAVDKLIGSRSKHRLLGYPDDVAEQQVSAICDSLYMGQPLDSYEYSFPAKSDWVLLLQMQSMECSSSRSADPCLFSFRNGGVLYFCIRRKDLEARNFDAAYAIVCGVGDDFCKLSKDGNPTMSWKL